MVKGESGALANSLIIWGFYLGGSSVLLRPDKWGMRLPLSTKGFSPSEQRGGTLVEAVLLLSLVAFVGTTAAAGIGGAVDHRINCVSLQFDGDLGGGTNEIVCE